MNSQLFRCNWRDLAHGLIVAVAGGILSSLTQVLSVPGFSFTSFSWHEMLRVALLAGVSYLAITFTKTEDNKVLGAI